MSRTPGFLRGVCLAPRQADEPTPVKWTDRQYKSYRILADEMRWRFTLKGAARKSVNAFYIYEKETSQYGFCSLGNP